MKYLFIITMMLSSESHSQTSCNVLDVVGIHLSDQFLFVQEQGKRCFYSVEDESLMLVSSFGERQVSDVELNEVTSSIIVQMNSRLSNFELLGDGLNSFYYNGLRFVFGRCSFKNQGYLIESYVYFTSFDGQLLMLNFSYPFQNEAKCRKLIEPLFGL